MRGSQLATTATAIIVAITKALATTATAIIVAITKAIVTISVCCAPNSRDAISRFTASAPARPMAAPIAVTNGADRRDQWKGPIHVDNQISCLRLLIADNSRICPNTDRHDQRRDHRSGGRRSRRCEGIADYPAHWRAGRGGHRQRRQFRFQQRVVQSLRAARRSARVRPAGATGYREFKPAARTCNRPERDRN